jgi:hypothetical protein
MNIKKLMYSFEDDLKAIEKFKQLGFNCTIDDPYNGIYYCEANLDDCDLLYVLWLCDECKSAGLDPLIEVDDITYQLSKDYDALDELVSKDPLLV